MSNENSKILISGASGNVGQHVVTQLAQKKVSARAGVHSEEKVSALRETGVDAVALDFDIPESITAAHPGETNSRSCIKLLSLYRNKIGC
jgi:uncharacterized protein YbjT (DUF2867 family)